MKKWNNKKLSQNIIRNKFYLYGFIQHLIRNIEIKQERE